MTLRHSLDAGEDLRSGIERLERFERLNKLGFSLDSFHGFAVSPAL
jgi:hypothetical protein